VGRDDLELVNQFQASFLEANDIKAALDDEAVLARLREVVDPEAEIAFIAPQGGALGAMSGPFRGVEGLQAGWREWLQPWEQFRIAFEHNFDVGDGRVLSLVELRARMTGGTEISEQGASIVRVRDGMVVAVDFYVDQAHARRDAGLD
jgi:ketosteroid isomerase-like protein